MEPAVASGGRLGCCSRSEEVTEEVSDDEDGVIEAGVRGDGAADQGVVAHDEEEYFTARMLSPEEEDRRGADCSVCGGGREAGEHGGASGKLRLVPRPLELSLVPRLREVDVVAPEMSTEGEEGDASDES